MTRSNDLFERAQRVIPGGVNSPVRAFNAVGGDPVYVASGRGACLTTVDGRELVDFCGSWGPLLFGHAHPAIVEAITAAARRGTSFGVNTEAEVVFAEQLCRLLPSAEMVRLVSSGTEAVMTAVRLARGFTGRSLLLKFDGCYHGHSDSLLVAAGSGLLTGGISASEGVPATLAAQTHVVAYNDLAGVERIVDAEGDQLAAIILEPVAGNMGLVPPQAGFLAGLRALADRCGALLIFDEVISGFRLGPTTYGEQCGVRPDLICLGKIIGGGLPMGALAGRREVMSRLAPLGGVYQAGTLSGNPVAVAAGATMLRLIETEPPYARLEAQGATLAQGLAGLAARQGVPLEVAALGGVFTPFFRKGRVHNLADAKASSTQAYARFFQGMLARGFYLPPSQFECAFLSAAHQDHDVEAFLMAAGETFAEMD